jgi:hypothetical protein
LREKLRKIEALFASAGTTGARLAAKTSRLIGNRTQAFDAGQMTVWRGSSTPTITRSARYCSTRSWSGTPYEVEFVTIASIVDKLRAKARETPAGFWVEGYFFDDTKVKDKGVLDIRDLDQVSSEHPVAVRHRGGHTSYCNSKALALAGVTRNTPTRPRGRSFATPMANSTAG